MSKKRFGHKKAPKKPASKSKLERRLAVYHQEDDNEVSYTKQSQGTKRDRHSQSNNGSAGNDKPARGRGDSGLLLTDPNKTLADTKLVGRAVRSRWGVRRKKMIRDRLERIVSHEEVLTLTKDGPEISMSEADRNAIAASRVLVAMNGQDQADDFEESKAKAPPVSPINVNIDARQSPIIQLAKQLGARTILIDGAEVPVEQSAGKPPEAGTVQSEARESVVRKSALAKARALLESDL